MSQPYLSQHFATEALSAYLDGELAAAEAQSLQAHLASCAECAGRLQALHATAAALRSLERPAPPLVVTERLRRQLATERERRPRPLWLQALLPWRTLQPGLAAAALVFVTALLTLLHFERVASRNAEMQASVSRQRSLEEREQEAAAAPTVVRPVPTAPAPARRSAPERPAELKLEHSAGRADAQPELGAVAESAEVATAMAAPMSADQPVRELADQNAIATGFAPEPARAATPEAATRSAAAVEHAEPATRSAAAVERAEPAAKVVARYPRAAGVPTGSRASAPIGAERAAAGRVFVRLADRWLEQGVALNENPTEAIGRDDPLAVELLRRWPELDGLLADRLPVRMRHDERIVELLP